MSKTLLERYTCLRDEAEQVAPVKGTPEYSAYACIVTALQMSDPQAELERVLDIQRRNLADNEARTWNSREGYRGYYARKIGLLEQAMREVAR